MDLRSIPESPRPRPVREGTSPAIAQWFAAKAIHPHALLFFRMGDFYELFFADAEQAAAALDIQLTRRGTHEGVAIPMCGVPLHASDSYLAKLIRKGFRVAIAEQTEDPRTRASQRGPLARAVVRLVTPGTLTEEGLLDPARANLLLAVQAHGSSAGAAWVDISTGRFETELLAPAGVPALLGRLDPAEVLADDATPLTEWRDRRAPDGGALETPAADTLLAERFAPDVLTALSAPERAAAARVLAYLKLTQAGAIPALLPPRPLGSGTLCMDEATRASLELLGGKEGRGGGLLQAVRRTLTAAGARLLAERIASPLAQAAPILERQSLWQALLEAPALAEAIRLVLRTSPDMARALGRLSLGRPSPRDLASLRDGQAAARALADLLGEAKLPPPALSDLIPALALPPDLRALLDAALAAELPARLDDPGVIAQGHDGELDALRALRDDSRSALAGLQLDMAQRYGVASLRIRHHQQLGYVMEVPAAAVDRLRAHPELILRQSMANAARFTAPAIGDLDRRINEAAGQAAERERGLVRHLCQQALAIAPALLAAAAAAAELDVAQSCARLAEAGQWCRPELTETAEFLVEAGRHPVVEASLPAGQFVANSCDLSPPCRLLLLTGPNMAGKSTFLRQNALLTILAQAGLPVPARRARLGLVDRLFCRVGASDDLARGRSTFMVEMTEAATILNEATPRSLLVIDEVGRGTATLDGLAIAWAMLEALHNSVRARTIFATHFHELARLSAELPHLQPHTMRVKEWKGSVVFLHEVAAGAAGRSWGVYVARLAGVPAPVVRRAADILRGLEARGAGLTQDAEMPLFSAPHIAPPVQDPSREVLAALAALQPDHLTPVQALEALYRLRSMDGAAEMDHDAP